MIWLCWQHLQLHKVNSIDSFDAAQWPTLMCCIQKKADKKDKLETRQPGPSWKMKKTDLPPNVHQAATIPEAGPEAAIQVGGALACNA